MSLSVRSYYLNYDDIWMEMIIWSSGARPHLTPLLPVISKYPPPLPTHLSTLVTLCITHSASILSLLLSLSSSLSPSLSLSELQQFPSKSTLHVTWIITNQESRDRGCCLLNSVRPTETNWWLTWLHLIIAWGWGYLCNLFSGLSCKRDLDLNKISWLKTA